MMELIGKFFALAVVLFFYVQFDIQLRLVRCSDQ